MTFTRQQLDKLRKGAKLPEVPKESYRALEKRIEQFIENSPYILITILQTPRSDDDHDDSSSSSSHNLPPQNNPSDPFTSASGHTSGATASAYPHRTANRSTQTTPSPRRTLLERLLTSPRNSPPRSDKIPSNSTTPDSPSLAKRSLNEPPSPERSSRRTFGVPRAFLPNHPGNVSQSKEKSFTPSKERSFWRWSRAVNLEDETAEERRRKKDERHRKRVEEELRQHEELLELFLDDTVGAPPKSRKGKEPAYESVDEGGDGVELPLAGDRLWATRAQSERTKGKGKEVLDFDLDYNYDEDEQNEFEGRSEEQEGKSWDDMVWNALRPDAGLQEPAQLDETCSNSKAHEELLRALNDGAAILEGNRLSEIDNWVDEIELYRASISI